MHVFILEQAEASDAQSTQEQLAAERTAHEANKDNVFNSCRQVMSSQNMLSFVIELGLVG